MQTIHYSFFLLFIIVLGCTNPGSRVPDEVPRGENPEIPSKAALDALDLIHFVELKEEVKTLPTRKLSRAYYRRNELFSGWALQFLANNEHQYRYSKFENGKLVWQIGYYDNGNLDLDFHFKDDANYGSQKMWRRNGDKYTDTYFLEGGIQHGMQYGWHAGNVLSREALYDHGKKVYEVLFDEKGNKKEVSGTLPEKYK